MLEQERHPVLQLAGIDQVVIVEHQHDVLGDGVELVEQRREDRVAGRRLRRLQERQRPGARLWEHHLQRGDQVGPEACGLVVGLIEREPRRRVRRVRGGRQPRGEHCRLAKAGRRRDQRQPRRGPLVQALGQSRAWHQPAARPGDIKLGLEQRGGDHCLLSGTLAGSDTGNGGTPIIYFMKVKTDHGPCSRRRTRRPQLVHWGRALRAASCCRRPPLVEPAGSVYGCGWPAGRTVALCAERWGR
jgi:hypothetical protein